MSTASIVLEDHEGAIACKLTFSSEAGGFDPASHAHQHAQILIRLMDQILENRGPLPGAEPSPIVVPQAIVGAEG